MTSLLQVGFEPGDPSLMDVAPSLLPEQAMRAERLASIFHNYGFFPESYEELSRATTLQGFERVRHPAYVHLGEVFTHQKRAATGDPKAAVRRITGDMSRYATEAQRNFHFAAEAKATIEVAATEQPHFTSLAHIPDLVDPYIDGVARGYGQLVRYHDLSMYPQLTTPNVNPLKLDYTARHPDPVTARRIQEVLSQVRLYNGIGLARATAAGQLRRYEFWTNHLQEAALHPYAKVIARKALQELHVDIDRE